MNAFSINPNLVVVDRNQASLIQFLEKQGLDVILAALQNVGRLAHCIALDIHRTGTPTIFRLGAGRSV